jgi:AraC-like DNA-binding protein
MLADRTVDDVAGELGYADSAAFRRAYRRWCGAAPRVTAPRAQ